MTRENAEWPGKKTDCPCSPPCRYGALPDVEARLKYLRDQVRSKREKKLTLVRI